MPACGLAPRRRPVRKRKINFNYRLIPKRVPVAWIQTQMIFRFADPHRVAKAAHRHGAIAMLAAAAIIGFAVLVVIGTTDLRRNETRAASRAITANMERAQAILDREQRGLDQLALIAATGSDAAAQQFLDRLPSLAPGIRSAALSDPAGMVQMRADDSAGTPPDDAALVALAADAAKEAAAHPGTVMLVTQTLHEADGATALVGLARPWLNAQGNLAGVALVIVDSTAFAGLDLVRDDGSSLFGDAVDQSATKQAALEGFPLMLRYPSAATGLHVPHGAWPLIAGAVIGIGAVLGLLAVLMGRLSRARREADRQAAIACDLRHQLAETAAMADRTDEINRTKSQFFAQVTHELRTPLNAILGFSETIRQEMFGPVANPRYLEYAGLIHDAGAHLLSLINDLLDNARIEAGKMEIAPIRVAPAALARSALDLVELLAEDREIELTTAGLSTCPDLNIDPRAMKQVLVNLLSNAIKYTPIGGRIEMRFAERDDGGAAIAITDTGIGMSAEDLRVVFEPFGRAGDAKARRQQGTGLGLSLARALTRLHGGDLLLASRLDFGTTATVILPASSVFSASVAPAGQASAKAA
jgi:signal transduction histidine kinase